MCQFPSTYSGSYLEMPTHFYEKCRYPKRSPIFKAPPSLGKCKFQLIKHCDSTATHATETTAQLSRWRLPYKLQKRRAVSTHSRWMPLKVSYCCLKNKKKKQRKKTILNQKLTTLQCATSACFLFCWLVIYANFLVHSIIKVFGMDWSHQNSLFDKFVKI